LNLVARRANLETDAECVLTGWWELLMVDPKFMKSWRESKFPGGIAHACELETSMYLYLDGENVRKDKIKNGVISFNEDNSPFNYVDLFAQSSSTTSSISRIVPKTSAKTATPFRQRFPSPGDKRICRNRRTLVLRLLHRVVL
jgi:hypothetical protein